MGLARAAHVAWRGVGEEVVVIDLRGKEMFGLNRSGGAVWHLLDGRRGATELAGLVGRPDGAEEIGTFLGRLAELGLVVEGPSEGGVVGPVEVDGVGEPPAIVWQEAIRAFGGPASCGFLPGQGGLCGGAPFLG